MQLDTLGDKKTALFLIMSDTDATFNFLISMIYKKMQGKKKEKEAAKPDPDADYVDDDEDYGCSEEYEDDDVDFIADDEDNEPV